MRSILLSALLLATATPALGQALPPPAPVPGDGPEDARLKRLFYDSDERDLKLNPISAIFRGDMRYADQFGDYLSDARTALSKRNLEADLAALKAIDRARLTPTDQIAYDVFRNQTEVALRGFAPEILALTRLMPVDHFSGFQTFYPDFASGKGGAPFKTLADYRNNLKRNAGYAALYDRAIELMREGMAKGVVQPKLVVNNMIAQFDALIAQGVEGSVFYAPVTMFPDSIPAPERAVLTAAYAAQVRDVIIPAHTKFRDFLKTEYLPKARDTVGLSALPGGAALYAYDIEANTTLPLQAEAVHSLGLSEVARITREMEAQKAAVGFKGTLAQFFDELRTDPRFQPKTAAELRAGYEAIGKRIDARVREQFSLIPKTPLEIRPVPDYRAKTDAGGSYQQGTPDGSRPGIFYYNTYDLPTRYTWGMETLYLHEAVPGHHFQISLAQENAALPAFMRFGGNTAYVEGWALYAETLWKPVGMETDPYQRMGGLSDEMLRAMRLVVDSGIHAKGWSRDQAIAYMLANSPMGKTDATAEVERYIAIPGQALAYKIGQLTILKLKAEAQTRQAGAFDPRAFHAEVLDTGALPMPVLEKKLRDWMARK
ncbi:hypothetical protein GCM10011380_22520 [Sphingomonas metalli]|uniref:DUF885 domain-containing protein n=1 Tax=Sphingomonas metalli TaxID=1779358 RepID=A0A916WV63_9SPHN|nr:DUF885 domain-containing protein [Sphingomonas metalli]GGB32601.1 hypothetical protein GCM10011380_22520 [Sphingomonas metalli]